MTKEEARKMAVMLLHNAIVPDKDNYDSTTIETYSVITVAQAENDTIYKYLDELITFAIKLRDNIL